MSAIREGLAEAVADLQLAVDAYRAMASLAFDVPDPSWWADAETQLDEFEGQLQGLAARFGHLSPEESILFLPVARHHRELKAQLRSWRRGMIEGDDGDDWKRGRG